MAEKKTVTSYCPIEDEKTEHKIEHTQTPQGWPMVVHECTGCKRRTLQNNPEADAEKAAKKKSSS